MQTKETEIAHAGHTPDQFGKWLFINIKKYKMFKIRKDYLGIILFEMVVAEPWWGLGRKTPETF